MALAVLVIPPPSVVGHLPAVRALDEEEIERWVLDIAALAAAIVIFASLAYLYVITQEISPTPRLFPSIIIAVGLPVAALLVVKEAVTRFIKPDLFVSEPDEVLKHLTGERSRFSIKVRLVRLAVIGTMIVLFFGLAVVNVLVSIVVCYPLALLMLGERDPKRIGLSSLALIAFVFFVFILLIDMPLDLF